MWRPRAVALLVLLALYAVTRLERLTILPVFIDEVTAIERSFDFWNPGRAPFALRNAMFETKILHPFLVSPLTLSLPDPIWAARLLSVLASASTLIVCYVVAGRLVGRRGAILTGVLYLTSPFAFVYDRLAVSDPLVLLFGTIVLRLSLGLATAPNGKRAVALGLALGLGALVKATDALFFPIPLIVWLFLGRRGHGRRFAGSFALALVIGVVLPALAYGYGARFAGSNAFGLIGEVSVLNGQLDLAHTLRERFAVARDGAGWLWVYLTPPVAVAAAVGIPVALATRRTDILMLAVVAAAIIVPLTALSRIWFPRYLLPMLPAVLMLSAVGIEALVRRVSAAFSERRAFVNAVTVAVVALVVLPAVVTDYRLVTFPPDARLPDLERRQFVSTWPSGYGSEQAAAFLRQEGKDASDGIIVVCPEFLGAGWALRFLLRADPGIDVRFQPVGRDDVAHQRLRRWAAEKPTFVVLERPPVNGADGQRPDVAYIQSIASFERTYPRPGGASSVAVYRVGAPGS